MPQKTLLCVIEEGVYKQGILSFNMEDLLKIAGTWAPFTLLTLLWLLYVVLTEEKYNAWDI